MGVKIEEKEAENLNDAVRRRGSIAIFKLDLIFSNNQRNHSNSLFDYLLATVISHESRGVHITPRETVRSEGNRQWPRGVFKSDTKMYTHEALRRQLKCGKRNDRVVHACEAPGHQVISEPCAIRRFHDIIVTGTNVIFHATRANGSACKRTTNTIPEK